MDLKPLALSLLLGWAPARAFAQDFQADPGMRQLISDMKAQASRLGTPAVALRLTRGIDVSHYQDYIDWDKLKGQWISFVYIKATEGDDQKDAFFRKNWDSAARIGLARGAYHFYNFCKPGLPQARNFIKAVPVRLDDLPPAIDLELWPGCKNMPERQAFRKELSAFIRKIKAVYGKTPVLYMDYDIYNRYERGAKDGAKIWVRDLLGTPQIPGWAFWQYSDHGRLAGINGWVDLDAFNGSLADLAGLAQPGPPVAAAP